VWVEKSNGTTTFSNDASFYQRAGLVGSGAVSLESVNFPGRYVRHSAGLLYLQALTTSSDRADATYLLE
jgi:hypothetical protein